MSLLNPKVRHNKVYLFANTLEALCLETHNMLEQGVRYNTCGLAIYTKKYLKAKEEL
jgi:hypothetical protein